MLLRPASEFDSPSGGTCFEKKKNQNSHVEMSTMDWSVLTQTNVFLGGGGKAGRARTLWFKSTEQFSRFFPVPTTLSRPQLL